MSITANQRLCKQSIERRKFSMDFAALLSSGETISGIASVTSEKIDGGATDLIITNSSVNGTKVEMFIEGGTSGMTYRIEVTITTNGSQILQGDGILYVSDR
jgi:hypothetical protein